CLNVRVHETSVPVVTSIDATSIDATSIDATSIDAARCDRDSNTPSTPDFQLVNGQNPRDLDTGRNRCSGAEPASPDDGFGIRQNRPLRQIGRASCRERV